MRGNSNNLPGFTVLELLVCLTAVVLLGWLLVPSLGQGCKEKGPRVQCLSNQKQVALSFLLWANDVGNAFPMELPVQKGGTKDPALQHNIVAQYLVVSNELNTPKILACPSDKKGKPAETFAQLRPKNVSYFLNLGATCNYPSLNGEEVLLGDRNLTLNGTAMRGYAEATNAQAFGWTNSLHGNSGNLALEDGSAHQANNRLLRESLSKSEPGMIRLLLPW